MIRKMKHKRLMRELRQFSAKKVSYVNFIKKYMYVYIVKHNFEIYLLSTNS